MTELMNVITLSGALRAAEAADATLDRQAFTQGFTTREREIYAETPYTEALAKAEALGVAFEFGDAFSEGLLAGVKARLEGYRG